MVSYGADRAQRSGNLLSRATADKPHADPPSRGGRCPRRHQLTRCDNVSETHPPATKIAEIAQDNIESIAQIEKQFVRSRTSADRLGEIITRGAGSLGFVAAHFCVITAWIAINVGAWPLRPPIDPYPFSFLGVMVSVEAVLLSTFVLMNQRRQTRQAEHWAHLNLQIGLLAEQEATKMLQMLTAVCDRLGLKTDHDRELKEMVEKTMVNHLAQEMAMNLEKSRTAETSPGASSEN